MTLLSETARAAFDDLMIAVPEIARNALNITIYVVGVVVVAAVYLRATRKSK